MAWWTSLAQGAAVTAATTPVAHGASSLFGPASRGATYAANRAGGNVIPDVPESIGAWAQGYMDRDTLNGVLWNLGINTGLGNPQWKVDAWDAIMHAQQQRLSLSDALVAYHRNRLPLPRLEKIFDHHRLWKTIDRELLLSPPTPLPLAMLLESINRGDYVDENPDASLRALGFGLARDRDRILRQRFALPGTSDLIRFSVREVWDDNVVRRFGYDSEFPDAFSYWMEKQGMAYAPGDLFAGVPAGGNIPWTRAYWRAHWEVLSPHQSYEALHRLRPERIAKFQADIPGVTPFTLADLRTVLKIHDYPPAVRDWLAAISFHPLTRVDIRRMYRLGVLTKEEVTAAYQDIGYTRQDAANLSAFTVREQEESLRRRDQSRVETSIRNCYELGALSRGRAAQLLYPWKERNPENLKSWRQLPDDIQQNEALSEPSVRIVLDSVDAKLRCAEAKRVVAAVRKKFVKGAMDEAQARATLARVPITRQRTDDYIRMWTIERDGAARETTAAQARQWFLGGLIGADEFLRRMGNLGYATGDARNMLLLAMGERLRNMARAQERAALTERQRRNAQIAQLRAERAERNRIIADLNRSASKAAIERFYRLRLVTYDEAKEALVNRGVSNEDAKDRLQAVDMSRRNGR